MVSVSMIALGGPKLKLQRVHPRSGHDRVSMIALGGPKLKLSMRPCSIACHVVSMIALGGPKLKLDLDALRGSHLLGFNDSTGWA